MDISIVTVNWNTRDILLECLESLEQHGAACNMEVIVVDNGSEDGSQMAVRRRFPDVKLIENGMNLGFAKANNIGMKVASGRYLCLINSDIKVREGCIDRLIRYMDANPGVGMVGPKILNPDLTIQDSCRRFPSLWTNFVVAVGLDKLFPKSRIFYGEHMFFFSHDKVMDVDYLAGCFMMVRRETINQIGLMDERFFIYQEEVDWCKRLGEGGWRVTFFPGAEAVHHHGTSSSRDPHRFALAQQRSVLLYWVKYHNIMERGALICILAPRFALRLLLGYLIVIVWPRCRPELEGRITENKAFLSALFRHVAA